MKKYVFMFSLLFILILSPNCFAANWIWVTSNDECSLYIDSYNVNFNYNSFLKEIYIDCYANYVFIEEDEFGAKSCIQRTKFRVKGNATNLTNVRICTLSSTRYDANGHVINSYTYPREIWDDILPNSFASALYYATWNYYRQ